MHSELEKHFALFTQKPLIKHIWAIKEYKINRKKKVPDLNHHNLAREEKNTWMTQYKYKYKYMSPTKDVINMRQALDFSPSFKETLSGGKACENSN